MSSALSTLLHAPVYAPLQRLQDAVTEAAGIQVYIKREDLIHPQISGNKWRKLKYNLLQAAQEGKDTLLTFGGAYSNHIYAVAAAGKLYKFRTIGIIRGEEHQPLNATLSFARACGMHLHYLDRTTYQQKEHPEVLYSLQEQYGNFYLIPEGGSNALAVKGCMEIIQDIPLEVDYLCLPCGTGGTMAGLVAGAPDKKIIGFSALKGGEFLNQSVKELLQSYAIIDAAPNKTYLTASTWHIQTNYHFGGYAKVQPELLEFIRKFEQTHNIPLEQVYTGKMLYGVYDLLQEGYFPKGSTLVVLHTGGLQGRSAMLNF
ncbi:pyridoxal-phosphate dependent enzyme [Rhodocytophaga aerolata]|uniref:Pyridoxal-phosphate dependent enzyme n=1 Tax=Rhodocytophaga aerolata TaxID=455078 RepID=A0ABT8R774_9BACT|nr:pyridoxal-phosphate dependent enzyme [Rhodocytophaga aerolata]MDO1447098.1 pyridoxal-phosphate dependent enzyme [Rhodocytophaga aerolata]